MKSALFVVALVGVMALPARARAQHSRPADTAPSGTAAPISSPPPPAPSPQPSTTSSSGSSGSPRQLDTGSTSSDSGRRRGDQPQTGTARPRGSGPRNGVGGAVIPYGGFYPWGYAYGLDAIAASSGYYGGYLGAYDPWYGWSPAYAPAVSESHDAGALRLKVKPVDAKVYVDGYFVGLVDDYDGIYQRLHLDAGPHRIEMRLPEHQTLSVDVMIQPDFTMTYRGALKTQQP